MLNLGDAAPLNGGHQNVFKDMSKINQQPFVEWQRQGALRALSGAWPRVSTQFNELSKLIPIV